MTDDICTHLQEKHFTILPAVSLQVKVRPFAYKLSSHLKKDKCLTQPTCENSQGRKDPAFLCCSASFLFPTTHYSLKALKAFVKLLFSWDKGFIFCFISEGLLLLLSAIGIAKLGLFALPFSCTIAFWQLICSRIRCLLKKWETVLPTHFVSYFYNMF